MPNTLQGISSAETSLRNKRVEQRQQDINDVYQEFKNELKHIKYLHINNQIEYGLNIFESIVHVIGPLLYLGSLFTHSNRSFSNIQMRPTGFSVNSPFRWGVITLTLTSQCQPISDEAIQEEFLGTHSSHFFHSPFSGVMGYIIRKQYGMRTNSPCYLIGGFDLMSGQGKLGFYTAQYSDRMMFPEFGIVLSTHSFYDATWLLNCFMALLIMPCVGKGTFKESLVLPLLLPILLMQTYWTMLPKIVAQAKQDSKRYKQTNRDCQRLYNKFLCESMSFHTKIEEMRTEYPELQSHHSGYK